MSSFCLSRNSPPRIRFSSIWLFAWEVFCLLGAALSALFNPYSEVSKVFSTARLWAHSGGNNSCLRTVGHWRTEYLLLSQSVFQHAAVATWVSICSHISKNFEATVPHFYVLCVIEHAYDTLPIKFHHCEIVACWERRWKNFARKVWSGFFLVVEKLFLKRHHY